MMAYRRRNSISKTFFLIPTLAFDAYVEEGLVKLQTIVAVMILLGTGVPCRTIS